MAYLPFLQARKGSWTGAYVPLGIVDQRPWQTAAALAALAQSAEEKKLAREVERLADGSLLPVRVVSLYTSPQVNASTRKQEVFPGMARGMIGCNELLEPLSVANYSGRELKTFPVQWLSFVFLVGDV
jgi:hypothetical protein